MKRFLAIGLLLATASCSTAPKKFMETDRTGYYISCLKADITVSVCECAEAKFVEKTGITKNEQVASDEEKEKARKALTEAVEECSKETK